MAKRTQWPDVDPDEMISAGNMTLMNCIDLFDCSRGFKFSTYACRSILRSFSSVASRTRRYRSRFSVEFDSSLEWGSVGVSSMAVEEDGVDTLKKILSGNGAALSRVERAVIRERFAVGDARRKRPKSPKTLEQVGRILGFSKEWVRQIQNGALEKLRMAMEDEYLAA